MSTPEQVDTIPSAEPPKRTRVRRYCRFYRGGFCNFNSENPSENKPPTLARSGASWPPAVPLAYRIYMCGAITQFKEPMDDYQQDNCDKYRT